LYAYSQGAAEGEPSHAEEQDLANAMVATMFCPKLCAFLDNGALNPYSLKQVRRLREICEEVEVYVPKDDIKYKAILQAAASCFGRAVDETALLVRSSLQSSKPLLRGASPYPTKEEARQRFINRRLKLLRNLLLWRKHAGDLFGTGNLIGHLVDGSLTAFYGQMDEVGKNLLGSKLKEMLPAELLPAMYK